MIKRNCIEIAPRALLLAAGIILTVLLISVMVTQFRSAEDMMNVSGRMINEQTENLKYGELISLDGSAVYGSDVVNISQKQTDNGIKITLKKDSGTVSYTDQKSVSKMRDFENSEYIKPFTRWKVSVSKNDNGVITEIVFTEIKE